MRVYEGTILTVDKHDSVCRYLVEDKGRIVYVGHALPARYKRAERVQLGKGALIPSFCDSHQHFASFSSFHAGLNVMDCTTNAEILGGKEYKPQSGSVFGAIVKGINSRTKV